MGIMAVNMVHHQEDYSMTKIDVRQLANEIRVMNRQNILYRVLRDELSKRGFWRMKPRGDPAKGFRDGMGKSRGA
jgi:hypothetical protein